MSATTSNSDSDGEPDLPTSAEASYFVNVLKPGVHDVLCGRGGGTNNHSGNVKFRQLVNEHKHRYVLASKVDKPKVARELVKLWRALDPPGRFLARSDDSKRGPGSVKAEGNIWYDIGDKKGREKASQCLRERGADVNPLVKEHQRKQDYLTCAGIRMVEQQMRTLQDHQGNRMGQNFPPQPFAAVSLMNGQQLYQVQPSQVYSHAHTMKESDVASAFAENYFFNNGFQNSNQQFVGGNLAYGGVGPTDIPFSMQQMGHEEQSWNTDRNPFDSAGIDGSNVGAFHQAVRAMPSAATNNMIIGSMNKGLNAPHVLPDPVNSIFPSALEGDFDSDDNIFEEYRASMKSFKDLVPDDDDDDDKTDDSERMRLKILDDDQGDESWMGSFYSIAEKPFGESIQVLHHPKQRLAPALQREKIASTGLSSRTMQTTGTMQSAKTTGTMKTNHTSLSAAFSMSDVSMFSGLSETTRNSKMSAARELASNLSMLSELTDLSENMRSVDLQAKSSKR